MFSRNFGGIVLGLDDAIALDRLAASGGQLHHRADGVIGFRRNSHAHIVSQLGGQVRWTRVLLHCRAAIPK